MKILKSFYGKVMTCLSCFAVILLLSTSVYAAKDISAEQFVSMDNDNLILVDVRTPEEYADGHIPGAINLPLAELPERLNALPSKDQNLVVYCRSGRRAAEAIDLLKTEGYTQLHHLEGDYLGWAEDERPIAKP